MNEPNEEDYGVPTQEELDLDQAAHKTDFSATKRFFGEED
jgi:hypothetical protein